VEIGQGLRRQSTLDQLRNWFEVLYNRFLGVTGGTLLRSVAEFLAYLSFLTRSIISLWFAIFIN
jgi:hypothetical protein